jgi:peptidoglycan/xylan/chitin deacetylase (PgdA/CDA1 family)
VTLPNEYLSYPRRQRGMDHDRYEWSILFRRRPVEWPGGARLALWVVPSLEWFPLDMSSTPFRAPGALERPYPDYWNYTHRDYGNRVGIFRVMQALDAFGILATAAVNAAVCERYPFVIEQGKKRGWEFIAHGLDMGRLHHAGLSRDEEAKMVSEAVETVRRATGQPVRGWLSPANSESLNTPDLVAASGVEYLCDWINDDMPYPVRTQSGTLYSLPYSHEINDATIIWQYHASADEFAEQIQDQFDLLYREAARHGGRVLSISLHPWIIGQPHRIGALERALSYVMRHAGVWPATGSEILAAFRAQGQRGA